MRIAENKNLTYAVTARLAKVKTATRSAVAYLRVRPRLLLTIAISPLVLLLALTFWPRHITFSYSEPNCFLNPLVLPNLHSAADSESYQLNHKAKVSVGKYPLVSTSSCITAAAPPTKDRETIRFQPLHLPLIYKAIRINPETSPRLKTPASELERISVTDPLLLQLDRADIVFTYTLEVDEAEAECHIDGLSLNCQVQELELEQAENYDITVARHLNGHSAEPLLEATVETVTPVKISKSSIKHDTTVYQVPEAITLTMNKPIADYEEIELKRTDGDKGTIQIATEIEAEQLTINLNEPLPREATFELTVAGITATDRGFLASPYSLKFKTSGGPKVQNVSIGRYGVARSADPILTFNYDLSEDQDIDEHITIEINGNPVPMTIAASGPNVVLIPNELLPHCARFSVKVSDELENRYGATGGTAYEFSSRTICQRISTIGTSIEGRAIQAYRFGTGSQKIIYVGGVHGTEISSKHILDSWVQELEANFDRIPSNRTIIVVPNVNPDGTLAGTRVNARNVDLNRNFPANDWQADVVMPGGNMLKGGGGSAPLSEPESQAVANLIISENPRLVLSYHAIASLVIANEVGNSMQLARQYGQAVGYQSLGDSQLGDTFAHDTTGAMEDWLRDQPVIPNILIELTTYTGFEFSNHRQAMWLMARH